MPDNSLLIYSLFIFFSISSSVSCADCNWERRKCVYISTSGGEVETSRQTRRLIGCYLFFLSGDLRFLHGDQSFLHGYLWFLSGDLCFLGGYLWLLSGDLRFLSGYLWFLSGDLCFLSGDLSFLHGYLLFLSGDLSFLHGDLFFLRGNLRFLRGDWRTDARKSPRRATYYSSILQSSTLHSSSFLFLPAFPALIANHLVHAGACKSRWRGGRGRGLPVGWSNWQFDLHFV